MGRRLSSSFFHRPSPCSTEYAIHLRGPTWLQLGAARSERQGWLQAIAKRLALDGHEHGASLGWSVELSRQWAKRRQFEAELAMRGAQIAPQPCIRLIREDRNHDAVMRIGDEAPGGGPILHSGLKAMVLTSGHRHLGSPSADPSSGPPKCCPPVVFSFRCCRSSRWT